jgi:hypothetical protein
LILAWQLPLAAGNDWFSLIIFVLVVLGPIVVQALKKFKGETDEEETPSPPRRTTPMPRQPPTGGQTAQSEEIRKLLEALGKPRSAPPPILRPVQEVAGQRLPPQRKPKLQQSPPVVQRRPALVSSVKPANEADEEGPRNVITGESTRQPLKQLERVSLNKEIAAVELEVAQAAKPMTVVASVAGSNRAAYFAQLLANKTNVRQAVVLAEVIGPPKAFS